METNYLDIANHWIMWLSVVPVVVITIYQAYVFSKRAFIAAPIAGLSDDNAKKAFRLGMTSAFGPALGVLVVMLGLMAAIGGPIAWQRLSIIGAAPTELAAATQAATAMGVTLGGEGYGLQHYANALWVMALNGGAWLLFTGLFTDKLEIMTKKVSGGNAKTLGLISGAAVIGSFSYMFLNEIKKGTVPGQFAVIPAAISAAIAMVVLEKVAEKMPKIKEFNLGIAMLIGMFVAVLFK